MARGSSWCYPPVVETGQGYGEEGAAVPLEFYSVGEAARLGVSRA